MRHAVLLLILCLTPFGAYLLAAPPNVVLIMTDDQGYGDLGAHGNTMIRTPNLDRLHAESIRFTNFHVDPTCSPTRAALLTGRYSTRTGVWHTIMGRSLLDPDELTLAELFRANGYATGIFGKWHLGDNHPSRPQDQGFEEVLIHGGGGVGQTPDYWANDYFDDTYFRNGEPEAAEGYCTDVWFHAAEEFIEEHREGPFFAYIPTNAPHSPFNVDERYSRPYIDMGVPPTMARFYGMITNIDENIGRLRARLRELRIEENTLLIFMTDNGSAAGWRARSGEPGSWKGFNAGMRAGKGSEYEGGHRVPFFVHWPAGRFGAPRDVEALTAHIDLLPTLSELCSLVHTEDIRADGRSLAPLLRQGAAPMVREDSPRSLSTDRTSDEMAQERGDDGSVAPNQRRGALRPRGGSGQSTMLHPLIPIRSRVSGGATRLGGRVFRRHFRVWSGFRLAPRKSRKVCLRRMTGTSSPAPATRPGISHTSAKARRATAFGYPRRS